jgi:hypothetical protein
MLEYNEQKSDLPHIVYITRDIERALGCLSLSSVIIISNDSTFAKSVKEQFPDRIFLIPSIAPLDTYQLLEHEETTRILKASIAPHIVVFKNTPRIEKWCNEHGYTLLNPKADLAASIEEKITQLTTLQDIVEFMPRYTIKKLEELRWIDTPFVLQFNHSHTGSGTIYIDSEKKLEELKEKFPKRECRIAPFIEGPIFTSNIVIAKDKTMLGNMSYQITGIPPFTDVLFATIGNDWGAPYTTLNESERKQYEQMSEEVAQTLQKLDWKGLFGIDAIWSTVEKRWYLIEINARQPASASYESQLQYPLRQDTDHLTILEAHLYALLDTPPHSYELLKISTGAQIIQRVTKEITSLTDAEKLISKLEELEIHLIPYGNITPNSDLLRIQSKESIIARDGEFSDIGKKIKSILN